jgi:hypothetical protein
MCDEKLSNCAISLDAIVENTWDTLDLDFETLTIEDMSNGNHEFESAWIQLMKIMVPVSVLRMFPTTGDRRTPERKAECERIHELLRRWEVSLPPSFDPIEGPETMMILEDPPANLQPIYYATLNVAVAMGILLFYFPNLAHRAALEINSFTLTHSSDEPKPPSFFQAATKVLQICLGVQRMRQIGLFQVSEGGDYGILWPLLLAGVRTPRGELRTWILKLLSNWPREGMIVCPF